MEPVLLPIRSRMKRTCKCQWQQKEMSFDRMLYSVVHCVNRKIRKKLKFRILRIL